MKYTYNVNMIYSKHNTGILYFRNIMGIRVRVRVRNIYFNNEIHGIEETNTETFMCQRLSATIAYIELHMIKK